MWFWITSGGLALVVSGVLATAILRARGNAGPAAAFDLDVYRDQLAEIDRDAARGVIGDGEAQRLRNEVKRRILEADRALRSGAPDATGAAPRATTSRTGRLAVAAGLGGVLVAGAAALYLQIGAPGYPDLPLAVRIAAAEDARAARPTQPEAEAEAAPLLAPAAEAAAAAADPGFVTLIDELRGALQSRPDDLEGFTLLARNEARLGNLAAARAAQERVIALKGAAATADDHGLLADLAVRAAGGIVTETADAAIAAALAADPANGPARFYAGLGEAQVGRYDRAFAIWRDLLEQSTPDAPWLPTIRAGIGDLAALAGVRYTPPAAGAAPLRGPDAAALAAAGDMTPAQRVEMIRGMVGSLSERLATDGGSPDEWAQLIRSLGVIGEVPRAAAVWNEAQTVFADNPGAMDTVRRAAQDAGVAQ